MVTEKQFNDFKNLFYRYAKNFALDYYRKADDEEEIRDVVDEAFEDMHNRAKLDDHLSKRFLEAIIKRKILEHIASKTPQDQKKQKPTEDMWSSIPEDRLGEFRAFYERVCTPDGPQSNSYAVNWVLKNFKSADKDQRGNHTDFISIAQEIEATALAEVLEKLSTIDKINNYFWTVIRTETAKYANYFDANLFIRGDVRQPLQPDEEDFLADSDKAYFNATKKLDADDVTWEGQLSIDEDDEDASDSRPNLDISGSDISEYPEIRWPDPDTSDLRTANADKSRTYSDSTPILRAIRALPDRDRRIVETVLEIANSRPDGDSRPVRQREVANKLGFSQQFVSQRYEVIKKALGPFYIPSCKPGEQIPISYIDGRNDQLIRRDLDEFYAILHKKGDE